MSYVRTPRRAHLIYGQNNSSFYYGQPLVGFEYFVQFNLNGNAKDFINKYLNSTQVRSINPLVKRVDMPSIKIDTDDMNEYNRHRVSQSRMNFDPVTMVLHDVADGKVLRFWAMYYEYYFKDGLRYNLEEDMNDPNPPKFQKNGGLYGYHIEEVRLMKYLISSIDIYRIHAGRYDRTELINPRIVAFNQSELSYESGETLECEFTFQYENVHYYPMTELDLNGVPAEGNESLLYDYLATGEVLMGGRGRVLNIEDTPPYKAPGAAELDDQAYELVGKPGDLNAAYAKSKGDEGVYPIGSRDISRLRMDQTQPGRPTQDVQTDNQTSGFLANIKKTATNVQSKIPTFDEVVGGAADFVNNITGVDPIAVLEAGKSALGKAAEINALGGQFNQLQRDLFGEVLIEAPQADIRDFNKNVSTVTRGYEDVTRFTRNYEQVFGIGNASRNSNRYRPNGRPDEG